MNATASILLVDDDSACRHVMSGELRRLGHQLSTAASGEEALESAARQEPEIVLLDLRLPGIDGLETLRTLRTRYPSVEVIMLTGHGSIDTAIEAIREGAFDYATKPCPLDEITIRIQRAIERRALRQRTSLLEQALSPPDPAASLVGESPEFRRVAVAAPREGTVVLRNLDLGRGVFSEINWPPEWANLRSRLESRLSAQPLQGRGFRGPRPAEDGAVFELDFRGEPPARGGTPPPGPRETGALLVELDLDYIRSVLLPDALKHHLGAGSVLDYQAEVLTQTNPPSIIYRSDPAEPKRVAGSADASISFFDLQYEPAFRFGGRAGTGDAAPGPGRRLRALAVVCAPPRRLARVRRLPDQDAQSRRYFGRAAADARAPGRHRPLHAALAEARRVADGIRRRGFP